MSTVCSNLSCFVQKVTDSKSTSDLRHQQRASIIQSTVTLSSQKQRGQTVLPSAQSAVYRSCLCSNCNKLRWIRSLSSKTRDRKNRTSVTVHFVPRFGCSFFSIWKNQVKEGQIIKLQSMSSEGPTCPVSSCLCDPSPSSHCVFR